MQIATMVTGPLQVNTCLVVCESTKEVMITDPGGNARQILDYAKDNGLNIKIIALTHTHVDHIGAVGDIKNETNAEIIMHKNELEPYKQAHHMAGMFGVDLSGLPDPDRFVDEGDKFKVGEIEIDVLFTPGHSAGGITFHLKEANGKDILIAGDALFLGSIGRTDFPGGSYDTLINSIKTKLLTFPDDTIVITGHGPMTTVGQEKSGNPFLV